MLLNRISWRQMSAVGAAALVAGGMFTVSAFAQTDDDGLDPERAASTAALPDLQSPEAVDLSDDFFASPSPQDERDREDRREEARERSGAAVAAAASSGSGTGSGIAEPEPEPDPEPDPDPAESPSTASSAPSGSSSGGSVPSGSAKEIALQMVLDQGWDSDQFYGCLEPLWEKESNWNASAQNPSSGAYGIPQSLPGSKMASHGSDWQTNPATQIAWGIDYIKGRYGTPCGAWSHSQSVGWY
ncbi:lytic transglycosylase domain-containing protein [Nocardiopsis alba]|uniref:aggregation-promoting factor C-terminal-like domain-containing protein n=1 Tax=Nocardiopsis alba TaxID=53437 RepID=UPI0033E3D60F